VVAAVKRPSKANGAVPAAAARSPEVCHRSVGGNSRSVSLPQENRISWRMRASAQYRNKRAIAGCSPHHALDVKAQPTASGRPSRHQQDHLTAEDGHFLSEDQ